VLLAIIQQAARLRFANTEAVVDLVYGDVM
jgi:hypothetical protein